MIPVPVRFETLLDNHHDEIYGYLWRLLDSGSESVQEEAVNAADLTQEVFLRAYKTFERLRPASNYRAWLYKIATNCAYTALERRRRHAQRTIALSEEDAPWLVQAPLVPADAALSPDEAAILNETLAAVRRRIAALPARQRGAVIMRHVQGLGYDEIAQALNCSQDTARAHVYQAVRRLRRELRPIAEVKR